MKASDTQRGTRWKDKRSDRQTCTNWQKEGEDDIQPARCRNWQCAFAALIQYCIGYVWMCVCVFISFCKPFVFVFTHCWCKNHAFNFKTDNTNIDNCWFSILLERLLNTFLLKNICHFEYFQRKYLILHLRKNECALFCADP